MPERQIEVDVDVDILVVLSVWLAAISRQIDTANNWKVSVLHFVLRRPGIIYWTQGTISTRRTGIIKPLPS